MFTMLKNISYKQNNVAASQTKKQAIVHHQLTALLADLN